MLRAQFQVFAKYNAWANKRLYDSAAALSDADYRADGGAFFKSVHGTLNHLLATDRIWLQRFTGEGSAPDRLDAILFEALGPLREAREAEDRRIIGFVESLDDARLSGVITYRRVSAPELFEQQLWPALSHFFNHQTHHRGQAHALLTGLVGSAPELDLLYYERIAAEATRA
ncbi:DinB family protein [Methylocapsa aurea]|uniref:DinB family protein n=1 Tax=Methylocapsa aurea TaxID=663610 RepID=UPI000563DFCC